MQKVLYDFEKTAGATPALKKAQNLLNEARHNSSFVLLGKGVHNIEYAFKLLNTSNNKTEQALAAVDKDYKPREFRTQMTCTTFCHVGMERRTVPFNDIKFSHETHVTGNEMKCSDCHSPRENHGKTFSRTCAKCHHGKEVAKVKCEDCHLSVKRLVQGKGGIGINEKPSPKLGVVECTDCHRGILAKKKDGFDAVKKRCIECHDQGYGEMVVRWKTTSEDLLKKITPKIEKVREAIDKIDRRGGHTFVFRKLFGEAEVNFNLVKDGKGVHNPEYVEELLKAANQRLDEAMKQLEMAKKN